MYESSYKNNENVIEKVENDWTGWIPLEANEDAWNEYIKKLGIKGIKCVEIWSFDDHIPIIEKPHYALIICFSDFTQVKKKMEERYLALQNKIPNGIFFAKQKIKNACGTFALIHSITQNIDKIDIGDGIFANWYKKAKDCTVEERSELLENDQNFSYLHKQTATNGLALIGELDKNPDSHFITYILFDNHIYEFDSRMNFPRKCGLSSNTTFLKDAALEFKNLTSEIEDLNLSALALVDDNF